MKTYTTAAPDMLNDDYFKRAERYAEARGDEYWFKDIYSRYRDYNGVTDSVWKTLSYLYSDYVADLLEIQYTIKRNKD